MSDHLLAAATAAERLRRAERQRLNSRLWALVKRAAERGEQLHTTHPVLAQVWRDPAQQANLSRAVRHFDVHALDESVAVGRRLAATGTADVVDAHLAVLAEQLGTFIVTTDHSDMSRLNARFERYNDSRADMLSNLDNWP